MTKEIQKNQSTIHSNCKYPLNAPKNGGSHVLVSNKPINSSTAMNKNGKIGCNNSSKQSNMKGGNKENTVNIFKTIQALTDGYFFNDIIEKKFDEHVESLQNDNVDGLSMYRFVIDNLVITEDNKRCTCNASKLFSKIMLFAYDLEYGTTKYYDVFNDEALDDHGKLVKAVKILDSDKDSVDSSNTWDNDIVNIFYISLIHEIMGEIAARALLIDYVPDYHKLNPYRVIRYVKRYDKHDILENFLNDRIINYTFNDDNIYEYNDLYFENLEDLVKNKKSTKDDKFFIFSFNDNAENLLQNLENKSNERDNKIGEDILFKKLTNDTNVGPITYKICNR